MLPAAGGEGPAVLTGDTVLGRGPSVVAAPDGALGPYLSTLRALAALVSALDAAPDADPGAPATALLPGHGPVRADAAAALEQLLAHRLRRLEQVRAAVAAGASTPQQVVETVYADVDRALWPAATLSVRAQLEHLRAHDGERGS